VVASFLAIGSCSSDNNYTSPHPEVERTESKSISASPYNENNPYDSIGIIHNIILSKVMDNANSSYTISDYYNSTKVQLDLYYPEQIPKDFFTESDVLSILDDRDNYYSNVVNDLDLDNVVKEELSNILNIIKNFGEGNIDDYNYLKEEIISYENSIINNTTINSENKQYILSFSSIARHSSYFWVMDAPPTQTVLGKNRWWKFIVVIGADVIGAAGGAALGSVGGVVGTGVGVMVGTTLASGGAAALVDFDF